MITSWVRSARSRSARQQPGERHLAVLEHVGVVDVEVWGDLLDGELDARQLLGVSAFQRLDGIEHQVVEELGLGARRRYVGRDQPSAQSPSVPVAPAAPPGSTGEASTGFRTGHQDSVAP
jgi:hypothetical protein